MRILFIAPQPFYEDRGSPIAIHEELKALSELGFYVDVVTYPIGKNVNVPGVRFIRTVNPFRFKSVKIGFSLKKIFLDVILLKKAFYLFCKKKYVCVHGVEEGAGIALLCKIFFKIPVIYDMQSSIPEQLREVRYLKSGAGRWLALQFERWLLKNADVIFATKGLAAHVLSIVPEKNVWEYSFPGIDYDQSDETPYSYLEVFKFPNVVYAGNFSSYQGLELLLEAASYLLLKITNIKFFLVGGTEAEISRLNKLVKQLNLEETVQMHPRVSRTEIAGILKQACVLALPRPRGDNVPLKIYDYIKSGRPIVATDIKAHTSILTNQDSTLVKPNARALADGFFRALNGKCAVKSTVSKNKDITEISSINETIKEAYNYVINLRKTQRTKPYS